MIKKVIHYTDYEGNQKETEAYFNLTKTECMDLDLEYEEHGGLMEYLKSVLINREAGQIRKKPAVDFIKLLVERSYGIRPKEDRSLFLKEDDNGKPLYRKFKQSPAYDQLVFDLLSGAESLDDFAEGVLPYIPDQDKEAVMKQLEQEGFGEFLSTDKVLTEA